MRFTVSVAVACFTLHATSAEGQDTQKLSSTKTFRCSFVSSVSADMDKDTPRPAVSRDTLELVFDQLDHRAGTGRLIGNHGGSDVNVMSAREAVTILEPLGSGVMHVTVIYLGQTTDGRFKAVHSRHTALPGGQPFPSQFYGSCRPLY